MFPADESGKWQLCTSLEMPRIQKQNEGNLFLYRISEEFTTVTSIIYRIRIIYKPGFRGEKM